ncbi:MAG: 4Fe-4S dicluster domain-containing protein [Clostridiaceae bacterium]|jgi:NAD-dependent dihydropyrimidine dehydrogenase PreA subunit|nr:4Fe-4S dicluster domain-containing protein [Clostridiaceae bacterium]
MVRKIVKINEEKCNGCGLCINACHEGALVLENGKARLISDAYCDGLGDCLPECPTGAIEIIEREAEAFDEAAVNKRLEEMRRASEQNDHAAHAFSGCPGSRIRFINRSNSSDPGTAEANGSPCAGKGSPNHGAGSPCAGKSGSHHGADSPCAGKSSPHHGADSPDHGMGSPHVGSGDPNTGEGSSFAGTAAKPESRLMQWPCQIRLISPNAPYFCSAHLLVAADCTAYAYAAVHQDFMKDRITIIGCPKLDDTDYSEKLAAILANNNIQSITVLRMEVPCCSGLVHAVRNAMLISGKVIPWNVVTISIDGDIISQNT